MTLWHSLMLMLEVAPLSRRPFVNILFTCGGFGYDKFHFITVQQGLTMIITIQYLSMQHPAVTFHLLVQPLLKTWPQ